MHRRLATAALVAALAVAPAALGACTVRHDDGAGPTATSAPPPSTTTTTTAAGPGPGPSTTTTAPGGSPGVAEGEGDGTVALGPPWSDEPELARVRAEGSGPFQLVALDEAGDVVEVLVESVAPYEGTVLVDAEGDEARQLQVRAQGPWAVEVVPATEAEALSSSVSGTGDQVFAYDGPRTSARVENDGSDELEVVLYSSGGRSRVRIAGSGNVGTTLSLQPGLLSIRSDGGWSIDLAG